MLKYSKEHEWALVEGDVAKVGISSHAVEELGDITFVELPEVGVEAKAGDSVGFVESVKAASDIYTPLSGEIIEINSSLEDSPETVNTDPLGEGWMFKLKISNPKEMDELLSEEEYQQYLQTL